MAKHNESPWRNRIINHHQLGGIETSVLDNGAGRGVRIAWVNTGSGLRYKVVLDRSADIVDAFFNQYSLTFLSHGGITAPRPDSDHDLEWLWAFPCGLVTTCGLRHAGGPEKDEAETRGLHGKISNIPAMLESVIQPDHAADKLDMSITALMKESRLFGPNLELRRTITSRIGESWIKIADVVTNRGNSPAPHMMLYHCNFGWPLLDKGSQFCWKGRLVEVFRDTADRFAKGAWKIVPEAMNEHCGANEACAYFDVEADENDIVTAAIANPQLPLAVCIKYNKKQLPVLTNWQHWGPGEYVTGIEPGTNPPVGQKRAKELGKLIMLKPGQSRKYEITLSVCHDRACVEKLIKNEKNKEFRTQKSE